MTKYRQVGGRLGVYIRANNPSTQQIQGLLADLLAGDPLLPTMREVALTPEFVPLKGLAGSGGGAVQRDALLQELAERYLPGVVDDIGQLINGLLDQPAGATMYAREESVGRQDRTDSSIPDIDAAIQEDEPIELDSDFILRNSKYEYEDEYYEQSHEAPEEDYAYNKYQSWFAPVESWSDEKKGEYTSFSPASYEGRYIGQISSILKAPTGLVVQWCNRNRLRGGEWIGPETYLDNEECFFVLENYKPSNGLMQFLVAVLAVCFIAAAIAFAIAL